MFETGTGNDIANDHFQVPLGQQVIDVRYRWRYSLVENNPADCSFDAFLYLLAVFKLHDTALDGSVQVNLALVVSDRYFFRRIETAAFPFHGVFRDRFAFFRQVIESQYHVL